MVVYRRPLCEMTVYPSGQNTHGMSAEWPRLLSLSELPFDDKNQSYEYTYEYRYSAGGTRVPRSGSQNAAAGIKAE
jgi:hypothetical protein